MKRLIVVIAFIIAASVANILFGSVISWMLSIAIALSLIFFSAKLGLENIINNRLKGLKLDDPKILKLKAFDEKWKSILTFSLLTLVFLSTIGAVWFTLHPGGKSPWFTNNDYYGLSNSGIAFKKQLKIFPAIENDFNIKEEMLIAPEGNNQAKLTFNNYYQPVFVLNKEHKPVLINNIFDVDVSKGFEIKNNKNSVQIQIDEKKNNFFKRLLGAASEEVDYILQITSSDHEFLKDLNLSAPFNDVIKIEGRPLKKGMNLLNLFLDNHEIESEKSESYQVLEHILLELGESYLLASYNQEQKSIRLFPAIDFFQNAYSLKVSGQEVKAQKVNTSLLPFEQKFYIGFNNHRQLIHIGTADLTAYGLSEQKGLALVFDYPNTFLLKSPGEQEIGDRNLRFLTNDFDNVLKTNLPEGFYFTTYNLKIEDAINGEINYRTGKPNSELITQITDYQAGSEQLKVQNGKFSLKSTNANVQYLFELKDYSKNRFALIPLIVYLSLTYLAFIILSLFFGGKRIDRIEPIILSVIMVLVAIRYIMFWRLSTFPPLENISKFELENTLFNFDFNFLIPLPIPYTLVWTLLFTALLIIFRQRINKGKSINLLKLFKANFELNKRINRNYAIFILALFLFYIVNKKLLHIEILVRIVTILVPLAGYLYFSKLCNKDFEYKPLDIQGVKPKFLVHIKAYLFYLFHNPTFIISGLTFLFYAVADRGFAVLFLLFLILKNIFINFLKKPLDKENNTVKRMLWRPNNYWIYGFGALIAYLVILSFKSLFYYLLTYKFWFFSVVIVLVLAVIWVLYAHSQKLKKIALGATLLWFVVLAIPFTRNVLDAKIMDTIRFVQYRASIIHQPIGELMQQNEYTSFKTRKIIETAENQWFINSYITKPFDPKATINLRPHSKIGVDYSTQTRDVVVARYLIGEMGNLVMYLILILILLPMALYLISYRIHLLPKEGEGRDVDSYTGLIPLVFLFTLALFVWLTSTNRFVFFGQDFPFLSLTSRLSVILPLILYGITLAQKPTLNHAYKINLKNNALKHLFFFGLIGAFALTTIRQNELHNRNFSIVMDTAQEHIDVDLNNILSIVQDSLEVNKVKVGYNGLIDALSKDERFIEFKEKEVKDAYTKSVLENLAKKPSTGLQLNNPLFMIYDNGRYSSLYNKNLYLELPPIEGRKIWSGAIEEQLGIRNQNQVLLTLNNQSQRVAVPYYSIMGRQALQLAIMPANWFGSNQQGAKAIVNVRNNRDAKIYTYQQNRKNISEKMADFSVGVSDGDLVSILSGNDFYSMNFSNSGRRFAENKWLNGSYRVLYPLKEKNFWVYNFANAVRSSYSNDSDLFKNVGITLDFDLSANVQEMVNRSEKQASRKTRNYNFSAIGADGDGNIRFMSDFVSNRKLIDPNNNALLYHLQKQHFFFSNARNERDQWGNRNLLSLYLGVGSSMKPLTAALVSSQVNAGWERLLMAPVTIPEVESYAGFKLIRKWKNDEHYFADVSLSKYIEVSSNFYQSLVMFLGSYEREQFYGANGKAGLEHLLETKTSAANTFPVLYLNGRSYYLPDYDKKKGNWPITSVDAKKKSFFGNENSLLANSHEQNILLKTKENSQLPKYSDRLSFVHHELSQKFEKSGSGGYFWSTPEPSSFNQMERDYSDIHQNFNVGLKTSALGGYPYRITPFMALQSYLSLFTQNKNFHLGVTNRDNAFENWEVDASWDGVARYNQFLAQHIFTGMHNVIYGGSGTARRLQVLKSKHPGYYFYAKTGTINEQTSGNRSSRRLIVVVSDKDMTQAENIGKAKLFGWFFATDNTGDFDWNMLQEIIDKSMFSESVKNYFNK